MTVPAVEHWGDEYTLVDLGDHRRHSCRHGSSRVEAYGHFVPYPAPRG